MFESNAFKFIWIAESDVSRKRKNEKHIFKSTV